MKVALTILLIVLVSACYSYNSGDRRVPAYGDCVLVNFGGGDQRRGVLSDPLDIKSTNTATVVLNNGITVAVPRNNLTVVNCE